MALSKESIAAGRDKVSEVRKRCNEVRAVAGNLKVYLNSNDNYGKFVYGTSKGQELNIKLLKMLGLMDQNLTAQTINLTMQLNNFFNKQEELNK